MRGSRIIILFPLYFSEDFKIPLKSPYQRWVIRGVCDGINKLNELVPKEFSILKVSNGINNSKKPSRGKISYLNWKMDFLGRSRDVNDVEVVVTPHDNKTTRIPVVGYWILWVKPSLSVIAWFPLILVSSRDKVYECQHKPTLSSELRVICSPSIPYDIVH